MLLVSTKKYSKRKNFNLKLELFKIKKFKYFIKKKNRRALKSINKHKNLKFRRSSLNFPIFKVQQCNKSIINTPFLITNILYCQNYYKFMNALISHNGIFFFKIVLNKFKLFSYYFFDYCNIARKFKFLSLESYLGFFNGQATVSNLELFFKNGIKYIRSNGSKGLVLFINYSAKTALITLPSGENKLFSVYSSCSRGYNFFPDFKFFKKNNKIMKRSRGFKSRVRGVAMNAVDHPHGGNTKSIKFPRTP